MNSITTLQYLQKREYSDYYSNKRQHTVCGYTWDMIKGLHKMNYPSLVHDGCVNTVRFSLDGSKMISGSDDKCVKIWEMYGQQPYLCGTVKTNHTQNIFCSDLCPHNENMVVSCSGDGTLRLNDLNVMGSEDYNWSSSVIQNTAKDKILLSKESTLVKSPDLM